MVVAVVVMVVVLVLGSFSTSVHALVTRAVLRNFGARAKKFRGPL